MDKESTGTMLCSDCEKLNIAMRLVRGLSWGDSRPNLDSIMTFDKETRTILIDEKKLLRLIQLVTPHQKDQRIELI